MSTTPTAATAFVIGLALAGAGPAVGQTSGAPAAGPVAFVEADDDVEVTQFGITADELDDADIYGRNNERVGEIESVLVDAHGRPVAVSIEVGGFLGIGERDVIIPLERFRRVGDPLVTDLTKDEIEALPDRN